MDKLMNKRKIKNFILDHVIEVMLVILVIGMWMARDTFMSLPNWMNILRNISLKGVIAFAMTMVIISGEIDLSVGSTVALSGVIVARLSRDLPESLGVSVTVACLIGIMVALLAAVLLGFIHATARHKFGMPSFIVTLASLNLIYGLSGIISGGFPIANAFPVWFKVLGTGRVGGMQGLPVPAIIMIVMFAILFFVMKYTSTGRSIYAVGGNVESARLSGINVYKTRIIVFSSVQVMCVLGGLMNSAQVLSGSYSFGRGWELDIISSVVIGGASMSGGIGKAWGTLMGIIFLGVMINGMTILNVSVYFQYAIRAALMFLAVMISTYQAKAKA